RGRDGMLITHGPSPEDKKLRFNRSSIRLLTLTFALATAGTLLPWKVVGQQRPSDPATNPDAAPRQLMDRYCVTCHNEKLLTAGLRLDKDAVDANNPTANPQV